jgi:ribosomal protein S18 acetylase RimI-like enzyme
MEIVIGSEKYFEECLIIVRQLPKFFTPKALETINMDLKKNLTYIVMDSNNVLGFIVTDKGTSNLAEIKWLAIAPGHHHRGLGTSLIKYTEKQLKTFGVEKIMVKTLAHLEIDEDNDPYQNTRKFYEKLGFVHQETLDPYPGWDPRNPCAVYIKIIEYDNKTL